MEKVVVYSHPNCLLKYNGLKHPERKERLETVLKSIKTINRKNIILKESSFAKLENLYFVHPKEYINELFNNIPVSGLMSVEKEPYADTFLCKDSKNAILNACGAGIDASNSMINGNIKRFFCAVRPPGHHAETSRANGFCFVNNIAITAKYLQKKFSIDRIGIIDFDVHHCNGTQEIFYNDKNVFCGSIHQFPLFPGTGSEEEVGAGNIFNAPIPAGTNFKYFMEILDKKILSKIDSFKPEIILVSAGFDAHKRDPLSNINLESNNFYEITKKIVEISNIHCNGRIISFLEGGYDLLALSESVKEHVLALH